MRNLKVSLRDFFWGIAMTGVLLGWLLDHNNQGSRLRSAEDTANLAHFGQKRCRDILDTEVPNWRVKYHVGELPSLEEMKALWSD